MASIPIQVSGGYLDISTVSVKAAGDNTERYSGIQNGTLFFLEKAGTHTYTVLISKIDCGTSSATFNLTCTEEQVCTIITNINF